jgi:hypothetical protein
LHRFLHPQETKLKQFLSICRENARAKERRNAVIASVPTEMKTGCFQDTQQGGNVVYMPIGLSLQAV